MSSTEKEVAVLFADISGSTRLYEKLGEGEAHYAVDRCIKRIERSVEACLGHIVKTVGDELQATFPSAEAALQAAVDMQQRVLDLPPASGVKLAIRIGFHFGPVLEQGGELEGETVNIAARMAGIARAGQIVTNSESLAPLAAALRQTTRNLDRIGPKDGVGEMQAVEILWQDSDTPLPAAPSKEAPESRGATRLCVRYQGKAYLLDEKTPGLSFGRGTDNDVIIEDRKASRSHAQIERHRSGYVLVDESTNGTFVTIEGEAEVFLRRQKILLRRKGSIAFGHSAASGAPVEIAEYEYL